MIFRNSMLILDVPIFSTHPRSLLILLLLFTRGFFYTCQADFELVAIPVHLPPKCWDAICATMSSLYSLLLELSKSDKKKKTCFFQTVPNYGNHFDQGQRWDVERRRKGKSVVDLNLLPIHQKKSHSSWQLYWHALHILPVTAFYQGNGQEDHKAKNRSRGHG